jgi:hypothetical protein
VLLDTLANCEPFESALPRNYAGRFSDVAALEKEFVSYASKDAEIPAPAE